VYAEVPSGNSAELDLAVSGTDETTAARLKVPMWVVRSATSSNLGQRFFGRIYPEQALPYLQQIAAAELLEMHAFWF